MLSGIPFLVSKLYLVGRDETSLVREESNEQYIVFALVSLHFHCACTGQNFIEMW